ncbi:hypothetical protein CDD83_9723 [Cordyceps sp. RAO-2017]|nr:hypothetical protein CDD83_9723 [Cordyceps sp. RAO-2017]
MLDVRLSPGAALEQPLPRGWTALAYVLDGRVGFGQGDAVDRFHCVVFEDDADAVRVEADAAAVGTSHLVIIAGPPLDQPIVQYGPFVLTSREAVAQALHDYRSCTNGFERARGWRSDIGRSMMP